jgi:hypothetical protein
MRFAPLYVWSALLGLNRPTPRAERLNYMPAPCGRVRKIDGALVGALTSRASYRRANVHRWLGVAVGGRRSTTRSDPSRRRHCPGCGSLSGTLLGERRAAGCGAGAARTAERQGTGSAARSASVMVPAT